MKCEKCGGDQETCGCFFPKQEDKNKDKVEVKNNKQSRSCNPQTIGGRIK